MTYENEGRRELVNRRGIYAVILAGGSGTRFWPLSRETCPKQLLQIVGDDTLLRQTIKRIEGFIPYENIWIITTEDKAEAIRFHLEPLGPLAQRIQFVREPFSKNTAPAIGLAAIYLNQISPDSIMVVMPSDHTIPNPGKFLDDLRKAILGAEKDYLVTFGIKPNRPETGYGYIKTKSSPKPQEAGLLRVENFIEKPDLEMAKKYFSENGYFWNSGIFVWKVSKILSEIQTHLPSLYKTLKKIESISINPNNPNELDDLYLTLDPISIDYGIMERCQDILMLPATFDWSDLGSWTALDEFMEKDEHGNIIKGNVVDLGSRNSTILSGERLVATMGLNNMVVVDTSDATLIIPKEKVQEVGKIVGELKKSGRKEHLIHKTVERPWGSYTVLERGEGYKIKRVVVNPGARLSLQLHRKRSEHWVVVSGFAKVTKGDETFLVQKDESIDIPPHTKHRLENLGRYPLHIIEVQSGDYLEEDDIERLSDDYGRI